MLSNNIRKRKLTSTSAYNLYSVGMPDTVISLVMAHSDAKTSIELDNIGGSSSVTVDSSFH